MGVTYTRAITVLLKRTRALISVHSTRLFMLRVEWPGGGGSVHDNNNDKANDKEGDSVTDSLRPLSPPLRGLNIQVFNVVFCLG